MKAYMVEITTHAVVMADDEHDAERRAACHDEYVNSPEFPSIQAEANNRGFRKATLSEVNASALSAPCADELFCWRGGLWVKA